VQGYSVWTPPSGTLGRIVDETRARVRALADRADALVRMASERERGPSFAAALQADRVAVIAEVKRRSPSKGDIAPGLAAADQARRYEQGGAAAISVLTEPSNFGGSLDDLAAVSAAVRIPVLRKDFLIDRLQLLEAKAYGASAVLLIARALEPARLLALAAAAREAALETLIEVRDEAELERALEAQADAVGINNRNLETLEIDPTTALRLLPLVPASIPAVAESGLREPADVERAAQAGAHAVLVGSAVSAAADPVTAVRALAAVPRRERGA